MVLLFVGFTIRYLYEYRKYLLDIYYIQNISMCRNTEKKCMHYENGIKNEKNIWKNLSLTWHNQGRNVGKREGKLEGKREGEASKVIEIVIKKYKKGCSVKETADMLEEPQTLIKQIYDVIGQCAPDYNVEAIYKILLDKTI